MKAATVLFLLLGSCLNSFANPDSLVWQQHFEQEFQRVKDWNERAIAEGRLEDTRYFLTYTPWEDFDLTQNDCSSEHGFDIQTAGSGEAFQVLSEDFCYQLKCHLKSFNDGVADCGGIPSYQNPKGVKLYAIYLKYFGSQKANVKDLENGKAVDYVKTNHTQEWESWLAENEKLKKMKFSESGGNQFMVLYSQHLVYTGNEDNQKFAVYSLNAAANDSLRARHGPCMQINYAGNDLAYPAPSVLVNWVGPKKFYNRVLSAIDYLSAEANLLECEACDGTIIEYAFEQLKTPEAQQFIIERCAAIEKDDRIKDYAFQIAHLIDALGPWYRDYENISNPDPDEIYNLSGSLDEYIAYLESGIDFLASKEKKLEKFIEFLASNEPQSITDLYLLLNQFTAADLAALTCEERAAAVQKLTIHPEFGRWIFSNSTSIENAIIKLFQYDGSAPASEIQCFLDEIESSDSLILQIVQSLDDGNLNANTYSRFFQVVNDLIRKRDANINSSDSTYKKIVWDQRTVYEGYGQGRPMVDYTQLSIANTGAITFRVEVIVGTQTISDPGVGVRTSSIIEGHNLALRPFETVYVVLEGGIQYAGCENVNDCSASYLEVPGIFLAYMIQKQNDQDRKEALQALAIASSAALVGVLIIETVPAAVLISYLQYAAKQCVLGASIDVLLQKGIHIMIGDADRPINATSVLFSCAESSVDVPGIEEINAIMSMAGGCIQAGVFDEEGNLRDEFSVNDCAVDAAIAGIMVILMDGGGKFLAHIKSLPIQDRIKLADAFVQQLKAKKELLSKALIRAQDNGINIPSLNCGVLTMALLHDQLAALVWAANDDCILDVVYRRFGLTPDFLFITANDLRQFLTITPTLTDDILEERAAALNTLFRNIPEDQRPGFLDKALTGDLGQAARALSDDELKLAWFEDMLASYDPNLPEGQQLVDAFVDNVEMVGAWERLHTLLPEDLRHFTTDVEHLRLFQNVDVQNALTWIKNNRPNLFNDFPDLSPGEIAALNYYTTNNGYQINFWLRGLAVRDGIDWDAEHADQYLVFLDKAMDKLPNYMSFKPLLRLEGRPIAEVAGFDVGQRLDYVNYISAAKNNKSSYINGFNNASNGSVENFILEIVNPNGIGIIDIEPFSQFSVEFEALVVRGKSLVIDNISYKKFPMPTAEEMVASSPQLTLDEANEIIREEFEAWATSSANPNAIAPTLLIPGSQEYENATKIRTLKVRIIE